MEVSRWKPRGSRGWFLLCLGWVIIPCLIFLGLLRFATMPNSSYSGPFHPLSDEERLVHDRLKEHVFVIAGEIGERNMWHYSELEAAAGYIEGIYSDLGYNAASQAFKVDNLSVRNLEAEAKGVSLADEIVIVGAHYDSVIGSPGANDNASGVAALLEIARLLSKKTLSRTVRFVAFVNEEPPFYRTGHMGSRVYASRSSRRGEKIVAMFSLETIGCYSDKKGSQHYPFPFSFFYPHTGNFVAFVGNLSSRQLVRQAIGAFRKTTAFPSEGVAAAGWLTGLGWSDHWSFWKEGYPAIMITDTALFRYGFYHSAMDTPEKVDCARLARVVLGLARVVAEIAGLPSQTISAKRHKR